MESYLAYAEYDTDWHVYVESPDDLLGYCTGVGPEEEFDPERATAVLRDDGWGVIGAGWSASDGEYPFTALVVKTVGI